MVEMNILTYALLFASCVAMYLAIWYAFWRSKKIVELKKKQIEAQQNNTEE